MLTLKPLPKLKMYQLAEHYTHTSGVVVPAGFIYNGASIPWFGWVFSTTPFDPRVMEAALIHDWIYHSHEMDRLTADKFFLRLLRQNFGWFRSHLMYWAVRVAAGPYWKNDSSDQAYIKSLKEGVNEI